ncbi:MAG: cation:proton antiporter [Synechococcaceae cyanobacterium]|nr:cation:proton antiporter [Synechococcaceae cyanobacterium]
MPNPEGLLACASHLIGAMPISVLPAAAPGVVDQLVPGLAAPGPPPLAALLFTRILAPLAGAAAAAALPLGSGPALAATTAAASATAAGHAVASRAALHAGELPLSLLMLAIGGIFLGTLAISKFSLKIGVPAILGVLIFGLMINPYVEAFNHERIETLHTLSLAMLLFYAGLRTQLRSIRGFLEYGVLLAVAGVISTSLILGLITWFTASPQPGSLGFGMMQVPLSLAMLVGACLGSIDAGATISVLGDHRSRFPPRLRSLLQFESSLSDPLAILFVGLIIGLSTPEGTMSAEHLVQTQLQLFVQKISSGVLLGVIVGYVARFSLDQLVEEHEQLLVLGLAVALLAYGIADQLGGSGFIASYVTGLVLCNNNYRNRRITPEALQQTLLPFNTMTEISVFLTFGIMLDPMALLPALPEGLVVGLGLMLVARPLSVLLMQRWSPFNRREGLLISWCGLRGAVPLALSFDVVNWIPKLRGVAPDDIHALIHTTQGVLFTVVVLTLLVQALTLHLLGRRLGLIQPAEAPG